YHTNTNPEYYTATINNQPPRPATGTEVYISALIVFIGIVGLL
ncbi:13642_t:CDS:1, partial [Ambispora gerdemannii]